MNAHEMFLKQVDVATPFLTVENEYVEILKNPKEVLEVSIPLRLDDGEVKVVKGWRSHHNNALGPYKGGVRYHPDVTREEVIALSSWMSVKCATAQLPFGGGKGGISVNIRDLSPSEIERLSRGYALAISRFMGTDIDIPAPDVYTNPQVMAWFVDTYEKIHGRSEPSCYTGKPVEAGGSLGRGEATSRGGMYVLRETLKKHDLGGKDLAVAIQGFGNVGGNAHKLLAKEMGLKVVAVSDSRGGSYNSSGLDYGQVRKHKSETGSIANYPEGDNITNEELFGLDVDILIPAAFEGVITENNASSIKAGLLVELANGPVTPAADAILEDKGVEVIPDVLANCGGVTVSCFEWIQGRTGDYWTIDSVNSKLDEKITTAFQEVWKVKEEFGITPRKAAYVRAISRIVAAMRFKGIWP